MFEYKSLPDRLEIKRVLGNGAFGVVKHGLLHEDNGHFTDVVVKMLRGLSNIYSKKFRFDLKFFPSSYASLIEWASVASEPAHRPIVWIAIEYHGNSISDFNPYIKMFLKEDFWWIPECTWRRFLHHTSFSRDITAFCKNSLEHLKIVLARYARSVFGKTLG